MDSASQSQQWRRPRLNTYALASALLASTNSILLGYDIGVMSGAALFIKQDLKISSIQHEILVGSLNLFSLIGSLASGKTSDCIGRRYTIVLAAAAFLAGALLMGLAPSYPFLIAGRAVAGIGVGYSLMIAPLYTAEVSPATTRGFLTSLPEVFINVGILVGYVVNYALSGLPPSYNWRLMLGLAAVPAVGIAAGVMAMPESPRWLAMRGRADEARAVLRRTSASDEEAENRLDEITKSAATLEQSQSVWRELLRPPPPLRRVLIAAVGINFFMQASGNDAVVYYTSAVFDAAGIHSRKGVVGVTVIMGVVKTSFVLISALFLDHYGRRPLLLLGAMGQALSLCGLGLGSKFLEHRAQKPVWAIVVCVIAGSGVESGVSVNRLVSGAVSMSFLSVSEKISFGGTFLVLSGIMVLASIFFYFMLPETRGKTLEEIGKLFQDKHPQTSTEMN
ncbi:hypothetical protein SASPL_114583 [Salvia splendens]|uniref:Major facilitator superfamily (MFS) profile domain-containing protein n=1 Tax=Salvia splendens TaxID=180675 RepID=A0A8X8Y0W8_SALSN|nr:hypothetical protein SASPL_114583 [Salvia splendens]